MEKMNYRRDLNLLDRVTEKVFKSNVKGMFAIIIAIIVIFLLLVGIFVPKMVLSSKEAEKERLENQVAANQVYESESMQLSNQISIENGKLADLGGFKSSSLTRVMQELESTVPSNGVRISSMQILSNSSISLNCTAIDENAIADFITQLNENEHFTVSSVSGARSESGNGMVLKAFSMTITYAFDE